MFGIVRYNAIVKRFLHTKINPEPWMHLIFVGTDDRGADPKLMQGTIDYAIYIWDTRQVLETGSCKIRVPYTEWNRSAPIAHDNYEQLVGANVAQSIIDKFKAIRQRTGLEAMELAPDVVKLSFRKIWRDGKRIISYRKNCAFTFDEDGTFKSIGSHFDDLRDLTQRFDNVVFIKPEPEVYNNMVRTASQYVHDHKNSWDCAHQLGLK